MGKAGYGGGNRGKWVAGGNMGLESVSNAGLGGKIWGRKAMIAVSGGKNC
jgi:hypothetical protein